MFNHNRPRKPAKIHSMPTNPKPSLPMQRLPIFRVHYKAFEEYVQTVFGFEFDFLFAAGVTAGCGVDYNVQQPLPATIAWERKIADLRRGQRTKEVLLILSVLVADGYIPAGKYTISTHKLPDPILTYRVLLQTTGDPKSADCVAYRLRFKSDPAFNKKADVLDKLVAEATA